jgi:RNA polymerase sigma-70 factor (ECF subfamily)
MNGSQADQSLNEPELLARAIKGDGNALTPLLYAHYERLLQRLRRNLPEDLRGVLDAEDVLQQAHIKAFRAIRTFQNEDGDSFAGWLTTVADNTLADEIRKTRRRKRGGGMRRVRAPSNDSSAGAAALVDLVVGHDHTPSSSAARHEAIQAVRAAVAGLPPRQREALSLVYLEGLSSKEAAERMGISDAAVRSLVDRGRDSLREALGTVSKYFSRK